MRVSPGLGTLGELRCGFTKGLLAGGAELKEAGLRLCSPLGFPVHAPLVAGSLSVAEGRRREALRKTRGGAPVPSDLGNQTR